jgi:hypothetical protein
VLIAMYRRQFASDAARVFRYPGSVDISEKP